MQSDRRFNFSICLLCDNSSSARILHNAPKGSTQKKKGATMRKISLEQVEIAFDSESGKIELTSRDPKLNKQNSSTNNLRLTISAGTSSYYRLLDLFQSEDCLELSEISEPGHQTKILDGKALTVQNSDPRYQLRIGVGFNQESINVDLRGNLLVTGGAGSGKSVLLRSVTAHANEYKSTGQVEVSLVDFKDYYGSKDSTNSVIKDKASAIKQLNSLIDLVEARTVELQQRGINSYEQTTDLSAHYLIIDDISQLFYSTVTSKGHDSVDTYLSLLAKDLFSKLLTRKASQAGVHVIASIQRPDVTILPTPDRIAFKSVAIMGRNDPILNSLITGEKPKYGSIYLTPRGRGVLFDRDLKTQELFQGYFVTTKS